MTKLKCIARYSNGPLGLSYSVGDEFEVDDTLAHFLRTDAPGCFEPVKKKAVRKPRKDKAVKAPKVDK